jgi:Ran-binding protein 3
MYCIDLTTVVTGEEDEMNVFHGRGKLYDRESGNWKERGAGLFKLNVNRETGLSPRIRKFYLPDRGSI